MANKRMFAQTIIDSDIFLDMPLSTQALYFHLSMRADDDGFVNNPKKISRMIGCGEDDLKLLIAKKFILTFESGVVVIKHWLIHNSIRKDRKTPTNYQKELAELTQKDNGSYTKNPNPIPVERIDVTPDNQLTTNLQPDDNQTTTNCQHSIDKISIDKISIDKISIDKNNTDNELSESELKTNFDALWKLYPNKKGKPKAYTAYKKAIKDGVTNKEIQDGIINYKKEISVKKTEQQYIAHGSTWFNQQRWQDEYDHTPNKPTFKGKSQHVEVIPEWMNSQDDAPIEVVELEDEETLKARLNELIGG